MRSFRKSFVMFTAACAAMVAFAAQGVVTPAAAAPTVVDFTYTGSLQQWTVPAGVTEVFVEAWGGHGGTTNYTDSAGGHGADVSGAFAVTPGDTLDITVAGDGFLETIAGTCDGPDNGDGCGGFGGGGSANYAGGGGGASSVQVDGGAQLVVAGGGGGAGAFEAFSCSTSQFGDFGGGPGGDAGQAGTNGHACVTTGGMTINGSAGGGAGTAGAAGSGGAGGTITGSDACYSVVTVVGTTGGSGSAGTGANGYVGGSGGGGYYGGGAGGDDSWVSIDPSSDPSCFPVEQGGGGGGGGGSDYVDAGATQVSQGLSDRSAGSNGLVRITIPEFRPDAQVKFVKSASFAGDGVYNLDGSGQSASAKRPIGKKTKFLIDLQNDGSPVADTFAVQGPKKGKGFWVRYFDGSTDVTGQVLAGTYTSASILPGDSAVLMAKVTGTTSGKHHFIVTTTSSSDGSLQDAVGITLVNP